MSNIIDIADAPCSKHRILYVDVGIPNTEAPALGEPLPTLLPKDSRDNLSVRCPRLDVDTRHHKCLAWLIGRQQAEEESSQQHGAALCSGWTSLDQHLIVMQQLGVAICSQ